MITPGKLAQLNDISRRTACRIFSRLEDAQMADGRERIRWHGKRRVTTLEVLLSEKIVTPLTLDLWRNQRKEIRELKESVEELERIQRQHSHAIAELRRVSNQWFKR